MKKIVIFVILIFITSLFVSAQQSLMLNTGKRLYVSAIKIDTTNILFYKNMKGKVKWVEMEDVFSWTREDSVEVLFYKPACTDVCFRIDQMRDYLHGKADGLEVKTTGAVITGFVVGASSGILFPVMGLTIISPVPPTINAMLFGVFRPKPEKNNIKDKYKDNIHYKEGYSGSIRRKRVISSIISGGTGLVLGIIARNVIWTN